MTIGIKTSAGDLVWIDAVISISENYTGKITSHPIETGAAISDSTILNNDKFSISGVITDSDISARMPNISQQDLNRYSIQEVKFDNSTVVDPVKIDSTSQSKLLGLLPESVTAFAGQTPPEVTLADRQDANSLQSIKAFLKQLHKQVEIVEILSFLGTKLIDAIDNCVITDISFKEDVDTGDALDVSMTIERVQFATLSQTQVGKLTWTEIQLSASKPTNKGTVDAGANSKESSSKEDPNDPDNGMKLFGRCLSSGTSSAICFKYYFDDNLSVFKDAPST